ncbi:type VI secretion lipoprotein TssJ [Burkholderia thailandensis]|uniref:Type VI secretion lipofamily protein n=1 Tax=Burkholderia thailandensis TaxID=57975 RepID=A0AAW9CVR2_BURTH|nr:type VI secretion lipoprotein TssJ [Burkholderia thailandensis]AIP65400.2 type VI secretion lipofamily protein [Burkholderia thailandensis]AOI55364.1 type VI secretion lipofamily protein [Burkholderia thailandensis]AOJ54392.1 type VI secretion lipofamily protein [Burkholderia thailandensis]AOJ58597.1 type VI secretion lipofamily protein [Burkholderia thailandensis]AOJ60288.1 type VI secretion lipofamily protein [Burkholderia thailandensis]
MRRKMGPFKSFVAALALGALAGCSAFSSSKPEEPRQLHVTLVGGSRLNAAPTGEARPIQTCVYVVTAADWLPTQGGDDSSCASRGQDSTVVADSRHVIAPNQVLQFSLNLPRSGDIWLVADADYARRPANYGPLRVRIEGRGLIHMAVWLDRDGIYNALLPGPVPVGGAIAASAIRTDEPPPERRTKTTYGIRRSRQ